MQVGQVLGGRYRLVEPLGSGGTAVVWHAHDEVLGRAVAVKLLADRHLGDSDSRRQIRAEARAAAALSHPNIAQVHDYGLSEDGVPYVVMELIRGGTLQPWTPPRRCSPRTSAPSRCHCRRLSACRDSSPSCATGASARTRRCVPRPGRRRLCSPRAVKPFKVQLVDAGPGAAPSVVFKHGNTLVQMTVTCSGGEPSTTTTTT